MFGPERDRKNDRYGWIDDLAPELLRASRELVESNEAGRVSDEAVAQILTAAIRLYVAKSDGEERTFPPIAGRRDSDLVHFGLSSFAESGSLWSHDLSTGETKLIRPSLAAIDPVGKDILISELVDEAPPAQVFEQGWHRPSLPRRGRRFGWDLRRRRRSGVAVGGGPVGVRPAGGNAEAVASRPLRLVQGLVCGGDQLLPDDLQRYRVKITHGGSRPETRTHGW